MSSPVESLQALQFNCEDNKLEQRYFMAVGNWGSYCGLPAVASMPGLLKYNESGKYIYMVWYLLLKTPLNMRVTQKTRRLFIFPSISDSGRYFPGNTVLVFPGQHWVEIKTLIHHLTVYAKLNIDLVNHNCSVWRTWHYFNSGLWLSLKNNLGC